MTASEFSFRMCPDCSGQNRPDGLFCWLCGKDISAVPLTDPKAPPAAASDSSKEAPAETSVPVEKIAAPRSDSPYLPPALPPRQVRHPDSGIAHGLGAFFLMVVFAIVLIGLFEEDAGIAIFLMMAAAPGLMAVVMSFVQGRSVGESVAPTTQILTFIVVSTIAGGLTFVAAFITFFAVCIVAIASHGSNDAEVLMVIIGIIGGAAALTGMGAGIWLGLKLVGPKWGKAPPN